MASSPTAFVFDKDEHIIIDNKVYARADIPEDDVRAIAAINYADQRIQSMRQDLEIYKIGRDRTVERLVENIKDLTVLAEMPAEEAAE